MKQFRGNWNQNDSSANDYIKGRTHWEEVKTTVVIEEQTISGFAIMREPLYAVQNPFVFTPNVGDTYTVTWDGISYELEMVVVEEANGYGCLGNTNYVFMEPGGDIPFAIIFAEDIFLVTESTAESHAISISTEIEKIHKLDKKYLPDDIASSKDLEELYKQVNEPKKYIMLEDDTSPGIYKVKITNGELTFELVASLNDFEYEINSDGEYEITGWKETYMGETSTKMIFPDNSNIVI